MSLTMFSLQIAYLCLQTIIGVEDVLDVALIALSNRTSSDNFSIEFVPRSSRWAAVVPTQIFRHYLNFLVKPILNKTRKVDEDVSTR